MRGAVWRNSHDPGLSLFGQPQTRRAGGRGTVSPPRAALWTPLWLPEPACCIWAAVLHPLLGRMPCGSQSIRLRAFGAGIVVVELAARRHAAAIYGSDPDSWELVTSHAIAAALPAQPPPLVVRRPVALANGLFVAGDHRDTASIQGALVSGRRAATAVLAELGVRPTRL